MSNSTEARDRGDAWQERIVGLVPRSIQKKHVAIVGCGSVGSFVGDELARAGVSRFLLADPDVVEWPNLTRTVYGHADIGAPKTEALARHLKGIFPDIAVTEHRCEIQSLRQELPALLSDIDLLVAAVDDPRGNGVLDRFCYALGIPAVFIGIYKGAKGGEVIAVDPSRTPCFGCATGGMRDAVADIVDIKDVQRDRDYGTNKLVAEIALGSDIHFVCSAAVKVCLSMLSKPEDGVSVRNFMQTQLDDGVHYLMLGMEPAYYIFPRTHANAMAQHAFQSLWLKTTRRNDCPRCGDVEFREPLL